MAMGRFFFGTDCAGDFDSRGVAIGPARGFRIRFPDIRGRSRARGAGRSVIAVWRNTPSAVGTEQS